MSEPTEVAYRCGHASTFNIEITDADRKQMAGMDCPRCRRSGKAFPTVHGQRRKLGDKEIEDFESHGGLTKREYFAAAAMTGILANPNNLVQVGRGAVECADELIEALKKMETLK